MFTRVLIANRGAIACRVIRTLRKLRVESVAVYSKADSGSLHVMQADRAVCIGEGPAVESYLSFEKIFSAAAETGAEAIHPGYGFLSENAEFAEACKSRGIIFIGPTPEQMRNFGLKHTARALAQDSGIPMLPGSELLDSLQAARTEANRIGYPVMLKSTAGGGGIGMRVCHTEAELEGGFDSVKHMAATAFKEAGVFLEKFVETARHIEVQIFGDGRGNVVALGERDCSAQRRNQKVVEETPAYGLRDETRAALLESSVRLARAADYQSAGTVEFLFDASEHKFYFLEVNTRLQVEHGVTEEVTGVDLVEWMVLQAAGELDLSGYVPASSGASIQARLYAEDANKNLQPSSGLLTQVVFPKNARIETWVETGSEISPFYDPMIAKIIVKADTRELALASLRSALAETRIAGIECNLEYLRQILASKEFEAGDVHTKWLNTFPYQSLTIDVLEPGTQTSVQDYPGRVGYWSVGVPPSGPMDDYAFRLANAVLGNESSAAALEITLGGPTLKFNLDTSIALTGAPIQAEIDGAPVPLWKNIPVRANSILAIRAAKSGGCRAYLAVHGGFDVPDYLRSKSTFALGKFGGHAGRTLRHGDVLHLKDKVAPPASAREIPAGLIPEYGARWEIAVLLGPHAAPEFFTEEFIQTFLAVDWKVHYNSSRTGIRLIGPSPVFSRKDGGEAGLHPSNIHDTEYAIGTICFTGDMPIILGKDGPSLGGFVCPFTIIKAELWKIGQLRPGDSVHFARCTFSEALAAEKRQDAAIATLRVQPANIDLATNPGTADGAVLRRIAASEVCPGVVYRQAGDKYILLEYGPLELDLELRFRVHALMEWLRAHPVEGVIELSPGVRSLQINFDSRAISLSDLLDRLVEAETHLPSNDELSVPTRIINLPLSYDDIAIRQTISKYEQSVRASAPWLPSNIEFIRRMNGLDSAEQVRRTVFEASYLVLGLGDVYLGAPCAVPIDPRHRLVTTKYNPARTWTVENVVGIGGVYMCIYGMEGPGGYQLVGRTVPVWNIYKTTREFTAGHPWLLRFFDQVRFYPMEEDELLDFREDFRKGRVELRIEEGSFTAREHRLFLNENARSIAEFRDRQKIAFGEERDRWARDGSMNMPAEAEGEVETEERVLPEGCAFVSSPITGSIWQISARVGDRVTKGQKVAVIEAMKMEVSVEAAVDGIVTELILTPGNPVIAGQPILTLNCGP